MTENGTAKPVKVFSLAECEKHAKEEDCWLIIHGKVYDVTQMLDEHPGGGDILVSASGVAYDRMQFLIHLPLGSGSHPPRDSTAHMCWSRLTWQDGMLRKTSRTLDTALRLASGLTSTTSESLRCEGKSCRAFCAALHPSAACKIHFCLALPPEFISTLQGHGTGRQAGDVDGISCATDPIPCSKYCFWELMGD